MSKLKCPKCGATLLDWQDRVKCLMCCKIWNKNELLSKTMAGLSRIKYELTEEKIKRIIWGRQGERNSGIKLEHYEVEGIAKEFRKIIDGGEK